MKHSLFQPRLSRTRRLQQLLPKWAVLAFCVALTSEASAFSYVVQANDTLAALAERFYGKLEYETVLVVGHITVTGVIAALGGLSLPTICDNVFSDLFLFLPAAGEAGLIHLHYGAAEDISPRCRLTPLHD
jgi:hypothetical protein